MNLSNSYIHLRCQDLGCFDISSDEETPAAKPAKVDYEKIMEALEAFKAMQLLICMHLAKLNQTCSHAVSCPKVVCISSFKASMILPGV